MASKEIIINDLINSLKATLRDNEGELSYWGEEIKLSEVARLDPSKKIPSGSQVDSRAALALLQKETIGDCRSCPLCETRNKIVFGVGNSDAKVMFVGEGPGFDEDRKGEPFVGKAGQLLDKILEAINLNRSDVYIANIVKCHPMVDPSQPEKRGNDRPPNEAEIQKCIPFLLKQIEILGPAIIVTLGATATKALLQTQQGITRLRGNLIKKELILGQPAFDVLPTYHPAALLRNPNLKRDVWEDMKFLRSFLANLPPHSGEDRDPGH